jgi:hypothetical protein
MYCRFTPGSILEECIVDAIQRSRKTLLILSPEFVRSHWCNFEMSMARNKLFRSGQDVIVAVILRPLPLGSVSGRLYAILKTRLYIEWHPSSKDAQQLFWQKLVDAFGGEPGTSSVTSL